MNNKVVAQISDIHIGGEYNGQFDCEGNLKKVVNKLIELPKLDMLVVTGDLCDNHNEEEYIKCTLILHKLHMYFPNIDVLFVGGNHDDYFKMSMMLGDCVAEGYSEELNSVFLNITDPKNGLTDFQKKYITKHKPLNVYMHYPVGYCPHKFMNTEEHNIKDPIGLAKFFVDNGVKDVFCGHYHTTYDGKYVDGVTPSVHICPSIQTQLNPNAVFCDPNDKRPGYSILEFNELNELEKINHFMVD
ncbi:MAG: metallophosphoesterase [Paludibacteraceae bacterium]|nr:metallophosphoesterase [Paludibacteraceae bacterium]